MKLIVIHAAAAGAGAMVGVMPMRIVMCVRLAFDRWMDGMNDRSIIPSYSSAFRRSVDRGLLVLARGDED